MNGSEELVLAANLGTAFISDVAPRGARLVWHEGPTSGGNVLEPWSVTWWVVTPE